MKALVDDAAEVFEVSATDTFGWGVGTVRLRVHGSDQCSGEYCVIHNPSQHALSDRPLHWRADTMTMERLCHHGVGHPDPDDVAYKERMVPSEHWAVHGCDGCCGTEQVAA